MTQDKIEALAAYLDTEPDNLAESSYDKSIFIVEPSTRKVGTGPEKAQKMAALVRKALSIACPEFADITVLGLFQAKNKAEQIEGNLGRARSTLKYTTPPRYAEKFKPGDYYHQGKQGRLTPRKHAEFWPQDKDGQYIMTRENMAIVWPNQARQPKPETLAKLERYEKATKIMEVLTADLLALPVYHSIVARFRANPETLAMTKQGIHALVNSLYFLTPDCTGDRTEQHQEALRAAFDGKPLPDERPSEPCNSGEYMVLTDEEAEERAAGYIKDSVWAFNADFLASQTGIDSQVFEALQPQCEGANDAVLSLIESNGNIGGFINDAIRADGRGHFMTSYDGKEHEQGELFIYRMN